MKILDLVHVTKCDAETIFSKVERHLRDNDVDLKKIKFAGMDGCSTMEGDHNGLKVYFDKSTLHFKFIHCGNHRLAHCFAHLVPKFDKFTLFDSLLINFYQFLKNCQAISIWRSASSVYLIYNLLSLLKLLWLVHGKAAERVFW